MQERTRCLPKIHPYSLKKDLRDAEVLSVPTRILLDCIKPFTLREGWQLILCSAAHCSRFQALRFHIPEYM